MGHVQIRGARLSHPVSTLFFIHLHKTGGTSVRHAAREEFPPEKMLMLYGKGSQWTSPAARAIADRPGPFAEKMARLSDHIVANDIAFFSSHLSAAHLPCFDPGRAFTILRDPVERVLSQYYFFRNAGRTEDTLEAFVERPEHRNFQHRKLDGLDLERLGIVGVLERYDDFIGRLNAKFGLRFAASHENRGGLLKRIHASRAGDAVRRRIEALNEEDAAIYARAVDLATRWP